MGGEVPPCEEGGTGWSGDRCSSKGRRGKGDKNRKQEEARVGWEVKGGKGRGHRWQDGCQRKRRGWEGGGIRESREDHKGE